MSTTGETIFTRSAKIHNNLDSLKKPRLKKRTFSPVYKCNRTMLRYAEIDSFGSHSTRYIVDHFWVGDARISWRGAREERETRRDEA